MAGADGEPGLAGQDGTVTLQRQGPVAVVTLNRPAVRNAMDTAMWEELVARLQEAERDGQARAVLLRGAGGMFSAGFDLQELSRMDVEAMERSFARMEQAFDQVERCRLPVVGLLRGFALGGACVLLLCCDLRVASRTARLGIPVARLGLAPGPAFARRLVRLAGPSRAMDLLMTARLVRAPEAMRWGLVNYLAADDQAEETAYRLALRVATLSRVAVEHARRWCRAAAQEPLAGEGSLEAAAAAHRYTASPAELAEGLRAWREKREPVFWPAEGGGQPWK